MTSVFRIEEAASLHGFAAFIGWLLVIYFAGTAVSQGLDGVLHDASHIVYVIGFAIVARGFARRRKQLLHEAQIVRASED